MSSARQVKILFFDDIFSDLFRKKFPSDQLVWDDNWMTAVEEAFLETDNNTGVAFEIVKSGEIDSWQKILEKEKPDVLLLDLFWPEEAVAKYGDRMRAADISLEVLPQIRKAYPKLPIICHTVKPDKDLMEKVYDAGATFFLEKISISMSEVQRPLMYIVIHLLRQA
ncbi:MAG: hypothetical protein CO012_00660 [Syntrophobacterales bacterium CG_4_8_14_3_um_filter_49_14]|nr:MAG: hypothetical protein COX52_09960 [Syntrophobacterales bacterium CG23_combo_of_CG06-09_8_20_14_all_48_27]PJC76753.1 MAG: hypothetical protein CO012_00660 [Syntrophobacterales bacterium CG_4_8_14_3_um_filter_49_14]